MTPEEFMEANDTWREAAISLAAAHTLFARTKHELEIAKANAWADGQITGVNADARKAALYIIVEPHKRALIESEEALMVLSTREHYWRGIVDFGIWKGISKPAAWPGLREKIDHFTGE